MHPVLAQSLFGPSQLSGLQPVVVPPVPVPPVPLLVLPPAAVPDEALVLELPPAPALLALEPPSPSPSR
jgi:hypothetical protein